MSRRIEGARVAGLDAKAGRVGASATRVIGVAVLAVVATMPAAAQTIADYSRVQRAALDAAMAQAAMRTMAPVAPAAMPASAASPGAVGGPAPLLSSAPMTMPVPMPVPMPRAAEPQVGGVFVSARRRVAEVSVDGHAWWLGVGEVVPGTSWRVEVVAGDRVELRRAPGPQGAVVAETRRVVALPPLP